MVVMALSWAGLFAQSAGLAFETEELVFVVEDDAWIFEGDFIFSNCTNDSLRQDVFFPVIQDEYQSEALDIEVLWSSQSESLSFTELAGRGFRFCLTMPPKSSDILRIRYRQELAEHRASYVLKTARSWSRPLAYGSYTLWLPEKAELIACPFDDPQRITKDGKDGYFWEFYDFIPDSDFEIVWRR